MPEPGLRERKKRRTRELIAATAARLFAERGYEHVSVLDIAAAAEVSEQTVYNHFPTKSELILDRDQQLRDELTSAIRERAPGFHRPRRSETSRCRSSTGCAGSTTTQCAAGSATCPRAARPCGASA